jgi:hypothetical protein
MLKGICDTDPVPSAWAIYVDGTLRKVTYRQSMREAVELDMIDGMAHAPSHEERARMASRAVAHSSTGVADLAVCIGAHTYRVARALEDDDATDAARRRLLASLMADCPACVSLDAYLAPRSALGSLILEHDPSAEVPT